MKFLRYKSGFKVLTCNISKCKHLNDLNSVTEKCNTQNTNKQEGRHKAPVISVTILSYIPKLILSSAKVVNLLTSSDAPSVHELVVGWRLSERHSPLERLVRSAPYQSACT